MTTSTVHLFVFDTMADWEYGHVVAGINTPHFQREPGRFEIKTAALTTAPVVSIGGLRVIPDLTLDQVKPSDSAMLVLPGGDAWDEGKNREAAALAAEFLSQGVPVAAICGATAGLARAGLLDAVDHTSNAREYLAQTGYQGQSQYREDAAVSSGNIITAAAMHSLEFARAIFAKLDLYPDAILDAWYNLYKTGDAKYFAELMKAAAPPSAH